MAFLSSMKECENPRKEVTPQTDQKDWKIKQNSNRIFLPKYADFYRQLYDNV